MLLLLATAAILIDAQARAIQPGELVVLTITMPASVDRVRVNAFDRNMPAYQVDELRWRALVGIDLSVKPGAYEVAVEAGGDERGRYILRVQPHRFPTRVLKVDEAFVNPPESVQAEIEHEARELARIWRTTTPERLWAGPFVPPVSGQAASRFGTRSIFNGQPRAPHSGADFPSPAGTPIHAPNAGRILLARPLYFSGNTVVIDHGLGLLSLLAHLSEIDVREGADVAANQIVGRVGATGRVTGPHLHWAVRVNDARVDALSVLALAE